MLASESAPLVLGSPTPPPLLCRLFLSCFLRLAADEEDEEEDEDEEREDRDDDLSLPDPPPLDLLLCRRRRLEEPDEDEDREERDDEEDSSPDDELPAAAAFFFFLEDVGAAVAAGIAATATGSVANCWAETAPIGCLLSSPPTPLVNIAWLSDFWNASGRLFAGCWRMNRL